MKITDVTLTLFAWDDIPATRYSANTDARPPVFRLAPPRI